MLRPRWLTLVRSWAWVSVTPLGVPVVPVRLQGLDKVLHQKAKMATPGPVRVTFGAPLTLRGEDYAALAAEVERAVRAL